MSKQTEVQRYFDAVIGGYDALQQAIETNMSRSSENVQQLEREVAAAQRENLELSKKISDEAGNPPILYGVLVSATVTAQTRALNFARLAYEQGAKTGAEVSGQFEELTKATQEVNDAALKLGRQWGQTVPMVDAWQQAMQAFVPATAKK